MTAKSWDDSDIVNASAGLDDELREIFADMEAVLGKPRAAAGQEKSVAKVDDDFDTPLPVDETDPWPRHSAGRRGAAASLDEDGLDEEIILPDEFELPPAAGRRWPAILSIRWLKSPRPPISTT